MLEHPWILPYPTLVEMQGEVTMGEVRTISRKPKERKLLGILRDCTPENRAKNSSRPGLESRCKMRQVAI